MLNSYHMKSRIDLRAYELTSLRARSGQLSVIILLFATVTVILVSGFTLLAASFLQLSSRAWNKSQAFAIAESGIEYYRWHLAHAPADYEDGTGHAGPYTHTYYNKDGTAIGTFILDITPPPAGSTVVTIESTGEVLADASISKIIKVQLGIESFSNYALASEGNLYFGTGTIAYGPIFSNGGINFNGIAYGPIESALNTYSDPNDSNKTEWAVHTDLAPADPQPPTAWNSRPDVFAGGRAVGIPTLDFTQITQTLSSIKSLAQASGTYYASSSAYGYDLALATSGVYSIYKVTSLAARPSGCTNTSNVSGWGTWSVGTESLAATGTIPANGVLFVEDDLWVRGQISNKHLTIGAGRFPENPSTWANITINSSTLYTNYNGSDTLAYIAQNNFNVGLMSDDVLRIDGAVISQNGRVGRYYYTPPNNSGNSNKCGPTVTRQKITLFGSIFSNQPYQFGFNDGTGYQERDIIYDTNLLYTPPPSFPLTTDEYAQISWDEVQ